MLNYNAKMTFMATESSLRTYKDKKGNDWFLVKGTLLDTERHDPSQATLDAFCEANGITVQVEKRIALANRAMKHSRAKGRLCSKTKVEREYIVDGKPQIHKVPATLHPVQSLTEAAKELGLM
jgi:hypothetical protein